MALNIEIITNARWTDPSRTRIQCDLKLKEFSQVLNDYNAVRGDPETHVGQIFAMADAGTLINDPTPMYTAEEWELFVNPPIVQPETSGNVESI
jgi:hypothetical protein